jgi:hypothetical protein
MPLIPRFVPGSVPKGASKGSEKAIPYAPVRMFTRQTAPRAESAARTRSVPGIDYGGDVLDDRRGRTEIDGPDVQGCRAGIH